MAELISRDTLINGPAERSSLSSRQRWLLFGLIAIAGVLNIVDRQIIAILKPMISTDLGWTDDDYGTYAAAFQGASAFAFLGTGWIVDRLGIKWANALGVAAWSLAACAHGIVRSAGGFLFARMALGATEAMGTPAMAKSIGTLLPVEQRGAAFGAFNAIGSLGAIMTPLAIPLLAAAVGWRETFLIAGIVGLLWTVVWLMATRGMPFGGSERNSGAPAATVSSRAILASRNSWAIIFGKTFSDSPWWFLSYWMADYFHRNFGLSGIELGVPLAIAFGSGAIGSLCAGWASSHLVRLGIPPYRARRRCLAVCALLMLSAPLLLMNPGLSVATALFAFIVAIHQAFSSNLFAFIADITPPAALGRTTSFGAFSGNIGGMVVLKVTGLLLTAGWGYMPMILFVGLSYSVAFVSLFLARPTA